MFSVLTILRIIFNIIFAYGNLHITNFISHIESQKDCPCSSGWKINNGKLFSSLLFIIGLVNIFISANNILSQVPIIGSSYVLIFVLILFLELFIVSRICKNLKDKENRKCDIQGYKPLCKMFYKISTMECSYIAIIISIIFFYL